MRRRGPFRSAGGRVSCGVLLVLLLGPIGCEGQDPPGLQEDELRVMIDSLLPVIAEASGLEVRREVSFTLQPREEVRAFIEAQLRDELGPEELAGLEASYKMLGLLPDTLDLRSTLLELYTEQVVGYYDPKTDALHVVEGVARQDAAPVVAHELVHALQDQWTNLDSLVARERGNDRQVAAQAAAEGQATVVMMALQASQTTGRPIDPAALPDLRPLLQQGLELQTGQFPIFQRAPRLLRESLLFPYMAGAAFVQALYRARTGDEPPIPFGPLLPQSTEQVLHPEEAFLNERDAPTEIVLGEAGSGWRVAYSNTLGELETSILLTEHDGAAGAAGGTAAAAGDGEGAAAGWDGDRYALLEGPDDARALVWYSVWDDAAAADRVAEVLRGWIGAPRVTGRSLQEVEVAGSVERVTIAGRPVVRLIRSAQQSSTPGVPVPGVEELVERGSM